ncbi:MAG: hypothetical protein HY556_00615 [Euryarchaeota archaeon]|nr:hypothetical protein [Euryarchaeota archaeon]
MSTDDDRGTSAKRGTPPSVERKNAVDEAKRIRVPGHQAGEDAAGEPRRIRVPEAILRKMYVEGSLANARQSVVFSLRNQFSTATIVSFPQLLIDGARVAVARLCVKVAAKSTLAKSVRDSQPFVFAKNDEAVFLVDTKRLAAGVHSVQLTADTREWGRLVVEFEASI